MSEVEVEAGAKFITLDDYGTAIYFIEQGEADVLTEGGEATQTLGPGDTLGEISLLLTGERTATVVARTPMRLLSLSGQDFERIRPLIAAVDLRSIDGRAAVAAFKARSFDLKDHFTPPYPICESRVL